MPRDLEFLEPEFRRVVEKVLTTCLASGVEMVPYDTLRGPEKQAKYWRQSRPYSHIKKVISHLEQMGAPYIAKVLTDVGPQYGPSVTGALPGESWHQWGLACDCYWKVDGRSVWDMGLQIDIPGVGSVNGYHFYQSVAQVKGAHKITFNRGTVDWPHIQATPYGGPGSLYSWEEINDAMYQRFGP